MIHLLTTGGTIASTPGTSGRNVAGALPAEALLDAIDAGLDAGPAVHTESLLQKPSNAINGEDLCRIAERCETRLADPSTDGIVITHGTDTLEDTAWFLQQVLGDCPRPVVVTGSQRALHERGSDAPRNLVDALRVAAATGSRGQGVLVVFDEAIHSASLVRKISSYRLTGFGSPGYGPVGHIDGAILRYPLNARIPTPIPRGPTLPRVDIVPAAAGSACPIDALRSDGAQGLIIDALGRGQVPPDWVPAIARAHAAGCPVAITSSTGSGPVAEVYEYPGSLERVIAAGAVGADTLSARQARLLLMLVLSTPEGAADWRARFAAAAGWSTV
jgi:L-asparaginase